MDQFPDGQHVLLRSLEHRTYLHADEDGRGVSLSGLQETMRAAWVVHRYGDAHHVLLHSAAYGRYLTSSPAGSAPLGCPGFRIELRDCDELDEATIRWNPYYVGSHIHLRQLSGGRYRHLRAHGTLNPLSADVVSADLIDNLSHLFRWVVERIPSTERVPRLPPPSRVTSVDATLPCSSQALVITVEPPGNRNDGPRLFTTKKCHDKSAHELALPPPAAIEAAQSVQAQPSDSDLIQNYLVPTVLVGAYPPIVSLPPAFLLSPPPAGAN